MRVEGRARALRIAVAGLGTVGAGVVGLLRAQADMLARRCGRRIEIAAVSARRKRRGRALDIAGLAWWDDAARMAREAEVDVVVELIGGSQGVAADVVRGALGAGRHVVTANKALLAHHGTELARMAEKAGVTLAFEASVAGGIPIIKALREGLAANGVKRVYGILNGTCNFILSEMTAHQRDFADVLGEAQRLGYAEADPSFDIDGWDSAHKLAILTSVAFGRAVDLSGIHVEGIRAISALDIERAAELGYRIKLLGIASQTDHGVEQRVHPCMVPVEAPIAHVNGVFNAVVVDGDFVGTTLFQGRGAGGGPTASAVVADLVDIARGARVPTFGVAPRDLAPGRTAPMMSHKGAYYVRLIVRDQPGVIAEIAAALRDQKVSMESMIQHGRASAPGDAVAVVLTTHETGEQAMVRALKRIASSRAVLEPPCMIRIEQL